MRFSARPSVPVFSWYDQQLLMRYTARAKHIEWRGSHADEARDAIQQAISELADRIGEHRLATAEGIVSANALHKRSSFSGDTNARLLLRGRFTRPISVPGAEAVAHSQISPTHSSGSSHA